MNVTANHFYIYHKYKKEAFLSEVFALLNWSSAGHISGMKLSTKNIILKIIGRFRVFRRKIIVKTINLDNFMFISGAFYFFSCRPLVSWSLFMKIWNLHFFYFPPVSMRYMLAICDSTFRENVTQYFCFQFMQNYSVLYPRFEMLKLCACLRYASAIPHAKMSWNFCH